mmetsp:Transcript_17932/g.26858  ORF Transcript_17932/g.26858 Transcript_17932/m.26858 type:complete len:946 (-) Transcript_17932:231-3068(-)
MTSSGNRSQSYLPKSSYSYSRSGRSKYGTSTAQNDPYTSPNPKSSEGPSITPSYIDRTSRIPVPQSDPRHNKVYRGDDQEKWDEQENKGPPDPTRRDLREFMSASRTRNNSSNPSRVRGLNYATEYGSPMRQPLKPAPETEALIQSLPESSSYHKVKSRLNQRENVLESKNRLIKDLKSKLQDLQSQVNHYKLKNTTLRKGQSKDISERRRMRQLIGAQQGELERLSKLNHDLKQKNVDLKNDISSKDMRERGKSSEIEGHKRREADFQKMLRERNDIIAEKEDEIQSMRFQRKIAEGEKNKLKMSLEKAVRALNSQESGTNHSDNQLKADIAQAYKDLEAEKRNHHNEILAIERKHTEEVNRLALQLKEMEHELSKCRSALGSSRGENTHLLERMNTVVNDLSRKFTQHIDLSKKLGGGDVGLGSNTKYLRLEGKYQELREKYEKLESSNQRVKESLGKAKGQLFQMQHELDTARIQRDEAAKQSERYKSEILLLKTEGKSGGGAAEQTNLSEFYRYLDDLSEKMKNIGLTLRRRKSEFEDRVVQSIMKIITDLSRFENAFGTRSDSMSLQMKGIDNRLRSIGFPDPEDIKTQNLRLEDVQNMLRGVLQQVQFLGNKLIPWPDDVKKASLMRTQRMEERMAEWKDDLPGVLEKVLKKNKSALSCDDVAKMVAKSADDVKQTVKGAHDDVISRLKPDSKGSRQLIPSKKSSEDVYNLVKERHETVQQNFEEVISKIMTDKHLLMAEPEPEGKGKMALPSSTLMDQDINESLRALAQNIMQNEKALVKQLGEDQKKGIELVASKVEELRGDLKSTDGSVHGGFEKMEKLLNAQGETGNAVAIRDEKNILALSAKVDENMDKTIQAIHDAKAIVVPEEEVKRISHEISTRVSKIKLPDVQFSEKQAKRLFSVLLKYCAFCDMGIGSFFGLLIVFMGIFFQNAQLAYF